jgi:hypothetical protein
MAPTDADNWLHFGLGAAMVLLGVPLSRQGAATRIPVNRTPPDDHQSG